MSRKMNQLPTVETAPSYVSSTIASLLTHIVAENELVKSKIPDSDSMFATPWKYDWVLIADYVERVKEWIVCGPESFVVCMCFIKRLEQMQAVPALTSTSIHRVFFTCLMLAVKVVEDETLNNADFAKVACIPLKELNAMELFVLVSLGFNATVNLDEYVAVKRELIHIDLLLHKSKSGNTAEMSRLGRNDGHVVLTVSNVLNDLRNVSPKRMFASNPTLSEKRNRSLDVMEYIEDKTADSPKKFAVPSILPSFLKRRISLEMFRSKTTTHPVVKAAQPQVLFRQDSA